MPGRQAADTPSQATVAPSPARTWSPVGTCRRSHGSHLTTSCQGTRIVNDRPVSRGQASAGRAAMWPALARKVDVIGIEKQECQQWWEGGHSRAARMIAIQYAMESNNIKSAAINTGTQCTGKAREGSGGGRGCWRFFFWRFNAAIATNLDTRTSAFRANPGTRGRRWRAAVALFRTRAPRPLRHPWRDRLPAANVRERGRGSGGCGAGCTWQQRSGPSSTAS